MQRFTFSGKLNVPYLVLVISEGRVALQNVRFLFADDYIRCENILIGLPMLELLGIASRTLKERNRTVFDGADCASVNNPSVSNNP